MAILNRSVLKKKNRESTKRQSRRAGLHTTEAQDRRGGWARPVWPYGAIFGAALALRFLYVASIHQAYFFQHLQTEPLRYLQWSMLILDRPTLPPPPYDEAPGYPFFLAAAMAVFGRGITAIACVQAVLDALSCVLIACIGQQWFGRRAGIVAGLIAACYGPLIYFSAEVLPPTLFLFSGLAAIAAAVLEKPRWLLSGTLWALALAVRLEAALAYPFILLDAWTRGRSRALLRTAAPGALLLVVLGGHTMLPSWPRVLVTTTGLNLWLGNNAHSDGVNPFIFGPLRAIAERVSQQTQDVAAADREFRHLAVAFWSEQPRTALRLLCRKLIWTWADRELPNTSDIEWQTAQSWLFRLPLFPLSFGSVLPFAAAGAVLVKAPRRRALLLIGLIVTGTAIPVLFFTNARFRIVMMPALSVLAGHACAQLPALLRTPGRGPLLQAGIAAAVAVLVAWSNFDNVRAYRVPQIAVNTGVLERAAGNFPAAVAHLRDGLAGDPSDAFAWAHLAFALEQDGRPRDAVQAYFDGLAQVPNDRTLLRAAAGFFQRQRLDFGLLDAYRRAETTAAQQAARERALDALRRRDDTLPPAD